MISPQTSVLISQLPHLKWIVGSCHSIQFFTHTLCARKNKKSQEPLMPLSYAENTFICNDGTIILNTYKCDGKMDCPDASDEDQKGCEAGCFHVATGHTFNYRWCSLNCHQGECICNSGNAFSCRRGGCVHATLLCNHNLDCPFDESDEDGCAPYHTKIEESFKCDNNQSIKKQFICDGFLHCWDGSDEKCTFKSQDPSINFQCTGNSSVIIPLRFVNDRLSDCPGLHPADEILFEQVMNGSLTEEHRCKYPLTHVPCVPGYPQCFPSDKLCVYEKGVLGDMLSCRNGEHLRGCQGIVCPYPFIKCSSSYCVPSYYLCDGQIDCPDGDDEDGCSKGFSCPGMLKCRKFMHSYVRCMQWHCRLSSFG